MIFIFYGITVQNTFSQDFHYSQFFVLPTFLNPAYIGKFRTDYRLGLIHRRQWIQLNTPYNTTGISGELNFRVGSNKFNKIGVGLAFVNDELGDGIYKNFYIIASGAYHRYLDELLRHRLSFGAQFSYVRKNIGLNDQFTQSQIQNYQYNSNLPSNELLFGNNYQYLNINLGVAYNYRISSNLEFETGMSIFNVTQPRESSISGSNRLPFRTVWNAMIFYHFAPRWSVTPQILFMTQGSANDMVLGGMFGYHLLTKARPVIYLGAFTRTNESIIPMAGFYYNFFYFGLSYDIVNDGPQEIINKVTELNKKSLGSIEFTLIYNGFLKRNLPGKLTVPCGIL